MASDLNEVHLKSYSGWEKINIVHRYFDSTSGGTITPLFIKNGDFYETKWDNSSRSYDTKVEIELEWAGGKKVLEIVDHTEAVYMGTWFPAFSDIKYNLIERVLIITTTIGKPAENP
ncbi:hypothetical protein [Algoriphagus hitonicola]|uniref:Uncharacterized protein n=1 Tax=Algoriphagus hitonicola TaxID=435880 RepID=A0A1I2W136_9BACT|nr:hypothetical protein [Algoriphagus hitonicola]SFG95063.1 hypothetical protein SAMN04487988_11185 [Algoriphagus hitonicola]